MHYIQTLPNALFPALVEMPLSALGSGCRFQETPISLPIDTLAEWLRRRPAKPVGSPAWLVTSSL